jgi:hypothetical protein
MKKIDSIFYRHYFQSAIKQYAILFFMVSTVFILEMAPIAAQNPGFGSEKTTWHGYDRYDFVMDELTLEITPIKASANEKNGVGAPAKGQRRCIVVVPKVSAAGNPWSWQGCYWDHRPQAEVELLGRGFYIAFITPDPGKQWDAWYAFLVEKHGFSKKPAFIGMSKGGVNEYHWASANPDKVSAIYGDNPAIWPEDLPKMVELAKWNVPLLNVCGTLDFVFGCTKAIENVYHQAGGRITIMVKEGTAHHPHSLQDPKVIADFIEQAQAAPATRPAFLDDTYAKSSYYGPANSYLYLTKEDTYATCRGPVFTPCYDRYDKKTGSWGNTGMSVLVPNNPAAEKLWVMRADRIDRTTSEVDLALLAKGYYIVAPPLLGGRGPMREDWTAVYKIMTDAGFSKRPVLEGIGASAGEAYAWAVENADKVSCIYGENPVLRGTMVTKENYDENAKVPHIDDLSPLANAGVSILHVCGSLDPWLDRETRVAEKNYKKLGGNFKVILRKGEGHFLSFNGDVALKPIVDFIIGNIK